MAQATSLDNVGITIDTGHALLAKAGLSAVEQLIRQRDPVATNEFIRDHLVAR